MLFFKLNCGKKKYPNLGRQWFKTVRDDPQKNIVDLIASNDATLKVRVSNHNNISVKVTNRTEKTLNELFHGKTIQKKDFVKN
jgi:hypothetical protein